MGPQTRTLTGTFFYCFFFLFQTFIEYSTILTLHGIATLHYNTLQLHYITLHYAINFNTKVTIQQRKKYVRCTHVTRVQSPKAEPTSY